MSIEVRDTIQKTAAPRVENRSFAAPITRARAAEIKAVFSLPELTIQMAAKPVESRVMPGNGRGMMNLPEMKAPKSYDVFVSSRAHGITVASPETMTRTVASGIVSQFPNRTRSFVPETAKNVTQTVKIDFAPNVPAAAVKTDLSPLAAPKLQSKTQVTPATSEQRKVEVSSVAQPEKQAQKIAAKSKIAPENAPTQRINGAITQPAVRPETKPQTDVQTKIAAITAELQKVAPSTENVVRTADKPPVVAPEKQAQIAGQVQQLLTTAPENKQLQQLAVKVTKLVEKQVFKIKEERKQEEKASITVAKKKKITKTFFLRDETTNILRVKDAKAIALTLHRASPNRIDTTTLASTLPAVTLPSEFISDVRKLDKRQQDGSYSKARNFIRKQKAQLTLTQAQNFIESVFAHYTAVRANQQKDGELVTRKEVRRVFKDITLGDEDKGHRNKLLHPAQLRIAHP